MTTNERHPDETPETDLTDALLDQIGSGAMDDLLYQIPSTDFLAELLRIRHTTLATDR